MVHINGGTSIVMQCSPLYAIFTIDEQKKETINRDRKGGGGGEGGGKHI